jgi:hypothetical protein
MSSWSPRCNRMASCRTPSSPSFCSSALRIRRVVLLPSLPLVSHAFTDYLVKAGRVNYACVDIRRARAAGLVFMWQATGNERCLAGGDWEVAFTRVIRRNSCKLVPLLHINTDPLIPQEGAVPIRTHFDTFFIMGEMASIVSMHCDPSSPGYGSLRWPLSLRDASVRSIQEQLHPLSHEEMRCFGPDCARVLSTTFKDSDVDATSLADSTLSSVISLRKLAAERCLSMILMLWIFPATGKEQKW